MRRSSRILKFKAKVSFLELFVDQIKFSFYDININGLIKKKCINLIDYSYKYNRIKYKL